MHSEEFFRKALFLLLFLIAPLAFAQVAPLQTASLVPGNPAADPALSLALENPDRLTEIARQFLIEKTRDFDGKTEILITPLDSRLALSACEKPIAYLSQGARTWGKTTVAIRCEAPDPWRIMVRAEVKVHATYLTASKALPPGHVISEHDLVLKTGEITAMRAGVLTEKNHAIGHTVGRTIQPGSAIWADQLKKPYVILQGQNVTVISQGKGFKITGDGQALNNAGIGQIAKVKMPNGKIVKGIAKSDGLIEVYF